MNNTIVHNCWQENCDQKWLILIYLANNVNKQNRDDLKILINNSIMLCDLFAFCMILFSSLVFFIFFSSSAISKITELQWKMRKFQIHKSSGKRKKIYLHIYDRTVKTIRYSYIEKTALRLWIQNTMTYSKNDCMHE